MGKKLKEMKRIFSKKTRIEYKLLLIIFLLTFGFRLFFEMQIPNFSSGEAYYHLRHVNYISENLKPIIYDELSYGGRYVIDSHLFHYILAFFNIFLPDFVVFKIIPSLLLSSLVIIVFAITKRITNNEHAALLSATISGFIPVYLSTTINQISINSLTIPIIFYTFYCFLNLEKNINKFIFLLFILPIINPLSFLLILSFIIYAILLKLDSIKIKKLQSEAITFSIFLTVLITLIIFKKAFISFGLAAVWQSTPQELLAAYFKDILLSNAMLSLGAITLIFGIIGFAFGLFREKKAPIYLIDAMILADFILLFFRLINFYTGILFLGILLTIMAGLAFEKFDQYFELTKFSRYKMHMAVLLIIIITLTLIVPAFFSAKNLISSGYSEDDVKALLWLKENAPKDSTVFSDIDEGHIVAAVSGMKNVADSNSLLAPSRYSDVVQLFKTESLVKALDILHKYRVDYIFFSENAKKNYNIKSLKYTSDENCFKEVYKNRRAKIYEVLC